MAHKFSAGRAGGPAPGGPTRRASKECGVPDLANFILRRSLHAHHGPDGRCSGCERSPVAGELVSVYTGERRLCALCVAALPEADREPLRRERVRASTRRLAVAPVARAA